METTATFGQWLKQRRKALGLTQKALAQGAGCAEVSVRKIESGDLQPSASLVAALAQALDVDNADQPALVSLAHGTGDDFTAKARLLRSQRPNNLPAQLTPLIGRSRDIAAVRRRLLDDGARLVTLVGPPGVGKTRLSLAVAEEVLEQFDDGAFFVRLAPVSEPDQVAAVVAQALGVQLGGPNPPELQLRAYLEEKHLLLVLDNFEQIVAAAPLVDVLLRRCPWLFILVTSRQPLRVRGERQVTVQPLALPSAATAGSVATAETMLRYPAVELFADRAEAVLPDFAVDDGNAAAVAELCRRLDGLPLAIELVAARVKLLPPAELLGRLYGPWLLSTDGLRDVSARQKTLRGAIGWSYDLLSPDEQTLFRYLSVFVGGFTLEAAELLCGDTLSPVLPVTFSPAQVLDGIGSLHDKSLLHRETGLYGGPRYVMLETLREYGLERMTLCGREDALHSKHASCLLSIVETADQAEIDPRKLRLNRLIDDDIHNLRAALDWFMRYDVQAALLLITLLLRWYRLRGPYAEAKGLLLEVFALPAASANTIPRAKALFEAGILMSHCNEPEKALAYEGESLALSQELGYAEGQANALLGLGRVFWRTASYDIAWRWLESALALFRALGEPGGTAHVLVLLGQIALYDQLDFPRARALAEESLAVARLAGFEYLRPAQILADTLFAEGDLVGARSQLEQWLVALRQAQEGKAMIAGCLHDLGIVATRQGDFTAAHLFLDQSIVLWKELGNPDSLRACYLPLAALVQAEGNCGLAVRLYRKAIVGVKHDPWSWGSCLLGLAALAQAAGEYELTARLLGATQLVDETVHRLFPIFRDEFSQLADATRLYLSASHFDSAWTEGHELNFDRVAEGAVMILEAALHAEATSPRFTGHFRDAC